MFSTLFSLALLILPAFAEIYISENPINQCANTRISWSKSASEKPSYNVLIVNADEPCGDALVDLGDVQKTVLEWNNNVLREGTKVQITVADNDGDEGWTKTITVGSGSTDCFIGAASSSSSASGSTPTDSLTGSGSSGSGSGTADSDGDADGGSLAPVGAANAGTLGGSKSSTSAAFTAHQLSLPVLAISAITAAFALAF